MTPEDAWLPKGRSRPKGESTPLRKDVRRNPQPARSATTAIRHKEGGKLKERAPFLGMVAISKHHSLHPFPSWFQARKWGATVTEEFSHHAPRDRHARPERLRQSLDPAILPRVGYLRLRSPTPSRLPLDPAIRPRVGYLRLRSPTQSRLPLDPAIRPRVGNLWTTTDCSPEARRGPLLHYFLQRPNPVLPHDPL